MNPLYPALKRFAFFRVSRQTAPAAGGADGNRSLEGDISLNSLTEAPVVFLAFAVGETASPERRRMQRGKDIPHVKSLEKTRV